MTQFGNQIREMVRQAQSKWGGRHAETRLSSRAYSPDPANLDVDAHLTAALDWLKRAHRAGSDHGVSYGVAFGADFDVSYPETTGYICQTFVEMSRRTGDRELFERAMEMGHWEADVQALTGEDKYREAACRVNRYLMARHDIRNPDLRLRGGLPGSWPADGPYEPLRILNWATKFLVDALAMQTDHVA